MSTNAGKREPGWLRAQYERNRTGAGAPKLSRFRDREPGKKRVRKDNVRMQEEYRLNGGKRFQPTGNKGGGRSGLAAVLPRPGKGSREYASTVRAHGAKNAAVKDGGAGQAGPVADRVESVREARAGSTVLPYGMRAKAGPAPRRKVLSVLSLAGWPASELAAARRWVGRWAEWPEGRAGQVAFLLRFGFAPEDAERLAD